MKRQYSTITTTDLQRSSPSLIFLHFLPLPVNSQVLNEAVGALQPCLLHLQLFPKNATARKPQPEHTTLFLPVSDGVVHVDTFMTDVRLAKCCRNNKKNCRVHMTEAAQFPNWFLTTYVPAGCVYLLTATVIQSEWLCFSQVAG